VNSLAIWLLPLAAAACWRWSKLVASTLLLAFAAALVYRYAWPWEGLRWVSAATGLAGAFELGRRAARRARVSGHHQRAQAWADDSGLRGAEVWRDMMAAGVARNRVGRPDVLAMLLVGSAVADALAYRVFVGRGLWVMAAAQIGWLSMMLVVSLWPSRRVSCSNG
jgi:hypothetical protein